MIHRRHVRSGQERGMQGERGMRGMGTKLLALATGQSVLCSSCCLRRFGFAHAQVRDGRRLTLDVLFVDELPDRLIGDCASTPTHLMPTWPTWASRCSCPTGATASASRPHDG